MDIGRTLTRAWEITWRWKALWVLGFLAALGQGGGANFSYRFSAGDFQNGRWPDIDLPPAAGYLFAALACLTVLIGIALFVISVMARGGLIAGVAQADEEGAPTLGVPTLGVPTLGVPTLGVPTLGVPTLGSAWAAGQRKFWTLFGIGFLTVLPVILLAVVTITGLFLLAGGAAFGGATGDQDVGPIMATMLACLCPAVCLIGVLGVVLAQIRIYAERAAVLEDLGWLAAFGRGWQVLLKNLGHTILLWLVFAVLGLIVGAIVLAITAPIVLPLAALFGANAANSEPSWALLAPVCGLGLIGMVVAALIGAIINTFTSATWTIAYRQMTASPPDPLS